MIDWQRLRRWLSADNAMWALSGFTALFVVWRLFRAGALSLDGAPMDLDSLARLGEFLAGVSAPVGIGWVARTFYLQRQQLNASIKAIREQMSQARDQYDRDHTPNFNVQIASSTVGMTTTGPTRSLRVDVTNHGAPSAPTAIRLRCFGRNGMEFADDSRVRSPVVPFADTITEIYSGAPVWTGDVGTLQIVEVDGTGAAARQVHQIFGAITQHEGNGTSVVLPEIDEAKKQRLISLLRVHGVPPRA